MKADYNKILSLVKGNDFIKDMLTPKMTKYIPHTPTVKQTAFLLLNNLDIFFGGACGGGKSQALLMAALQYVDIPGYNALLLRDTYANLVKPEGLVDEADKWLAGTDAKWDGDMKAYRFPSTATLSFGYLDGPRDQYNYQGPAYQFIGIDEAVGIREHQANYMFSRLRKKNVETYFKDLKHFPQFENCTDEELKGYYEAYKNLPVRFRCASNPPRLEQIERGYWVKEKYVNPETREQGVIFIPSRIEDNPHLDAKEYRKSLAKLDPITRKQLEDGDWDIQQSGRFFDRTWFNIVDKMPPQHDLFMGLRRWDLAATEADPNKDPAYTVGLRMYKTIYGQYYIDSVIRERISPMKIERLVRQTADMDGKGFPVRMEQEPGSSGVFTMDYFHRNILPEFDFREDKKTGSKIDEARPLAAQAEAGNVFLVNGHWIKDFLDEIELFPDGKFKDQVDAASGAYNELATADIPRVRAV